MRRNCGRGGPQAGHNYLNARFHDVEEFENIVDRADNKCDADNVEREKSQPQCESRDDSCAYAMIRKYNLTRRPQQRPQQQQQPFKPRRLGRGRASVIRCENDFRTLWIEENNEVRIWVLYYNTTIGLRQNRLFR